ncbi:DUF4179 domain-containing protein [Clostridium sp. WILCCON 0269]|uniref:DUF4179 domain-containing protein n=1 Tax=Candidatus Clostridium eludens TaxID=3381663 RepID=A0ABW8SMB1_9CLOT
MNRDIFDEKDILQLFNYMDAEDREEDDTDFKIDDLRKKRLRRNLLKQVKDKNSIKKFKYKAAAAVIIAVISIGVTIPALAKNISVLKSIIEALDGIGSDYGEYEKYSKVVNKSITDNGLTFTINEVLCDESSLVIGYTIKSEGHINRIVKSGKDIIEAQGKNENFMPFALIRSLKIDGKPVTSSSSGEIGKYLDDHTYINSETMDIGNKNLPSVFNVDLDIKDIYGVKGNWSFKFSVLKDEILKNTKVFKPNTTVKFPYGYVNVEKVNFTPINTSIDATIKYNKEYINSTKLEEEGGEFNWLVFDDKGNEITEKGGSGNAVGSLSSNFWEEFRFVSLKNIPRYLTVIPYRTNYNTDDYKKYKNAHGSIYIPPICKDINGIYPIELSQGKVGKLIIKEIRIRQDKTVVKYAVEGDAPFLQAKDLGILDDKGNAVKNKDENFNVKKDKNNLNDYIMEFEPLDKNTKYKIVTTDLGDCEIRNDLKFRIDLGNK